MARCPHCGVFEGDNHHSLCPALQRERDPVKHRHNGTDYQHANDCPHCWREASDIQSEAIKSLRAQLAEREREVERLREAATYVVAELLHVYPQQKGRTKASISRQITRLELALENDDG